MRASARVMLYLWYRECLRHAKGHFCRVSVLFCLVFSGCATGKGDVAAQEGVLREICPGFLIRAERDISFSAAEKRLICGDREGKGPQSIAWREIPDWQAKYHFKTFLEERGYFFPEFREDSSGRIVAEIGPRSEVTAVVTQQQLLIEPIEKRRLIVGSVLTPTLLNRLEKTTVDSLQESGYACPEVTAEADPRTGIVRLDARLGQRQNIVAVEESEIESLEEGSLRRYDAFKIGETYDGRLVTLTERRIMNDEVVQGAYFIPRCEPQGVVLRQEVTVGPPRVISVGFGANTEGIVQGRVSWRSTRVGQRASLIDVTLLASTREQSLNAWLEWYYTSTQRWHFLRPFAQLRHQNERPFESLSVRTEAAFVTRGDSRRLGFSASIGPAWNGVRTLRGTGPPDSSIVSLNAALDVISHAFEFYTTSPRTGFRIGLAADFSSRALLSSVTLQSLALNGQALWNFRGYLPPLWVLGFRWSLASTLTPEPENIPAAYRRFLGGTADIRGFGRKELPGNDIGALTSFYADVELRFPSLLPAGVQPFLFFDVGALGSESASLDAPIYLSPGVGARWESPIGIFRGTASHGYSTSGGEGLVNSEGESLYHWQFYLSFGEEF